MTSFFETYSKPTIATMSSVYDSNLVQASSLLLRLYLNLKRITDSLKENLEGRHVWFYLFRLFMHLFITFK